MTNHPAPAAVLVAPLLPDIPTWEPIVVATIPGGAQVCHIHAKNSRTATYTVEVIRYSCDPWDEVPIVVDAATIRLEAGIDLLCSESAVSAWVEVALPGWSYLSSFNACPLQVAEPSVDHF